MSSWRDRDALREHCRRISKLGTLKMKELLQDEKFRKDISEKNRVHALEQWQVMREKMVASMKGIKHPWAAKNGAAGAKMQSITRVMQWKNHDFRRKMLLTQNNSQEVIKKRLRSSHVRPTVPEKRMLEIIVKYSLPYRYVGDGSFIIGRKNPDFVNVNGEKRVIEVYGRYWHKNDNPEDRIKLFKSFGFETMVFWEDELEDEFGVLTRILGGV